MQTSLLKMTILYFSTYCIDILLKLKQPTKQQNHLTRYNLISENFDERTAIQYPHKKLLKIEMFLTEFCSFQ